jgi:hypothetical protein
MLLQRPKRKDISAKGISVSILRVSEQQQQQQQQQQHRGNVVGCKTNCILEK